MGGILDKLDEWLRGLLIEGITGNLSGMFDTVNTKVGEIAGEVGQTPLAWNSGVFSMIRNLSETVIVPIAGVILTFVMCYELIQLVTEKNNLHDVDTWMFFKWIFKTFCAVLIVTNTWNTNEKKIDNAIGIVANENKYHPIRDYLSSLVWDGTERIRFCLRHFLGADADDYTYEALKLFLLGAISRAFQPGCKFEIMLCLVGGQGAGKSTFFRLLAVRDEWFSDDLRKLDDDNVYRKLQGHWIIEMSEMMATANAKSIEEIKSFLSRQKEVYKIPYETHPADRPRQCVFGGTSNALDFLPLDRSGNRRFIPVMVYPEQAEVHILEDEAASRAYIEQMWAEAMEIYRSGRFKLAFSPAMQRYLKEHQRDFMPEDTKAGMIQAYLDKYTGSMVCSKQLYKEALNHAFDEPKQWEIREINEIMNQCITGWRYFPNPRMFSEYGRQKGWERENPATDSGNPSEKTMDGFVEVTEQMELPF